MSSIIIAGNTYPDVPSIVVPKSGGGYATYSEGGGGQTSLIPGVMRSDAELWKSDTYDKYIHADEAVTIPAYTTTSTTLKASESVNYTIDPTTYDYIVAVSYICIPEYSITTTGKGRFEYQCGGQLYELVYYPARTLYTLVNDTKAVTSTVSKLLTYGINAYSCYWTSATGVSALNGNSYGASMQPQTPTISGTTLTVKTPIMRVTGSSSYFSQTYWDAMTDIRYQYRCDLYRVTRDDQTVKAYAINSLSWHTFDCVMSASHTLT